MKSRLGSFEFVIEIEEMKFLVRGLTVGEYIDMTMKGLNKNPESFFKIIALHCILEWEDVYEVEEFIIENETLKVADIKRDDEGQVVYIEYSEENLQELDDSLLFYVGKDIYYKYSMVSKEEAQKYEAFSRWMYYASEDSSRVKEDIKTFDCEVCVDNEYYKERKCGLSELDFNRVKYRDKKEDVEPEAPKISEQKAKVQQLLLKNKLPDSMFRKSYSVKVVEKEDEEITGLEVIRDYYTYKECPTSFINYEIKIIAEKVYFANKSHIPFMSGGLLEQFNKFIQITQIVTSECNKIEGERMKREQDEAKRSRKK